jgi:hypothetical protein
MPRGNGLKTPDIYGDTLANGSPCSLLADSFFGSFGHCPIVSVTRSTLLRGCPILVGKFPEGFQYIVGSAAFQQRELAKK